MRDLEKKVQRCLNARLYEMQCRDVLVSKMRLWKCSAMDIEQVKELDKKYKNYT